jgi:hypothetical protein
MPACTWLLPLLIGIVATIVLLNILYEPYIKQKFADLGALIQLQTSRPVYYPIGWIPVDNNKTVEPNPSQGPITNTDSPLSSASGPVYNYYPQTPLNPVPTNQQPTNQQPTNKNNTQNLAYANPEQVYDAHKAYYWSMSGGYPYPYPYPFPLAVYSAVDMDKVRANENKI